MNPIQEFNNFVQRLRNQGLLDHQFDEITRARNTNANHFHVTQTIVSYLRTVDAAIAELQKIMNDQDAMDFAAASRITAHISKESGRIGGIRVKNACSQLLTSITSMNRERCLAALETLKMEYRNLHANLMILEHIDGKILLNME